MTRLLGWGLGLLVGLLLGMTMLCPPVLLGQTPGAGCEGAGALQAGGSGPCTELARTIGGLLDSPAVERDHWGIAVTGTDGAPIYTLHDAQLFQPASNAKLFTTAAAMAWLGGQTTYQTKGVARGSFGENGNLTGNIVLLGVGDANLSGRVLPYVSAKDVHAIAPAPEEPLRVLEGMADQIAATGLKTVAGDVIGDDTRFPWQPYAPDWAIDDAVWGYGAPVSALSINDNQLRVTIAPGKTVGAPATVTLDPAIPYYTFAASVTTGAAKGGSAIRMERSPGSKVLRVFGVMAAGAPADVEEVAIEDPAEYAALALKTLLEARGITVSGRAKPRHRVLLDVEGFHHESFAELSSIPNEVAPAQVIEPPDDAEFGVAALRGEEKVLAVHTSAPLGQDVVLTNKVSQNLHAELLLRQLGAARGRDGTIAQGARVVRQFLLSAGIDKDDFVFFDGSGLSGHDLVTPRATVRLLQYAMGQPWFAEWKSSLPVGGVDGSLEGRFTKLPLKGKVFAKTGTLGEARALSGYVECASGKTVIFSVMVGNHLPHSGVERDVMDRVVAAIAAAN